MKVKVVNLQSELSLEVAENSFFVLVPNKNIKNSVLSFVIVCDEVSCKVVYADILHDRNFALDLEIIPRGSNTKTDVIVRTVLENNGVFDFKGNLRLNRGVQNSKGRLDVKGLSSGENIGWISRPLLEVAEKDTEAVHKSGLINFNQDQLIYLGSRGLGQDEAREALRKSFLSEVVNIIPDAKVREEYTRLYE